MKIIRFRKGESIRHGVLTGDRVDVIEGTPFGALKFSGITERLSEIKLLAPVSPPNILAIGLNYRKHAQESGSDLPDHPLLFIKATTALNNPGDPIVLPGVAPNEVDFEAELAIVIGKQTRHISKNDAPNHILGYTCGNDVSARDCQKRLDKQWARAKSFDTFCPLGPWIETDLDSGNAPIISRVNGKTMQESRTSDMIFNCNHLVSYLSTCLTLLPGTVIMTGTSEGVGCARTPPAFLESGDTVEIEISGIGVLSNPVATE